MKFKKVILILIFNLLVFSGDLLAQCAMCKASLENNVSDGNVGLAARLNVGILYLFFLPYVIVGTLAILWYVNSRKNRQNSILNQKRKSRLSQLGL